MLKSSQANKAKITHALGVLLIFCASLLFLDAHAAVWVTDDTNQKVTLKAAARRIVSLAPHATELTYAAGAGAYLVGVSEYSDFPPEAQRITSIGGVSSLDLERIVTLKPDLIIAWGSGTSASQLVKLRSLGIPVFISEPRDFPTIASSLERLSRLTNTEKTGYQAAQAFRAQLDDLRNTYQHRALINVFYQIWRMPLMTLNDGHLVAGAIRLCGGRNIFGKLPQLAPTVSMEEVLHSNPDVIIAADQAEDSFSNWRRFPKLKAVAQENLFRLNGDLMNRPGPRILEGTKLLCGYLDQARSKR